MMQTVYTIAAELHAAVGDTLSDPEFSKLVDALATERGVPLPA